MTIMKMTKKAGANLLVALLVIALVGCGSGAGETTQTEVEKETGGEPKGGELKIAYPAQPPVLDPHVSTVIATTDIMLHVYETLVTVDADLNIQPMLAESYEQSEDGKTITFKLREGVKFHNGQEMKADDVVASMNRWKDGVGARGQFDKATFEAEDDYTVVLKMPEPLSTALVTLSHGGAAFAAIMPKEVIEGAGDTGVEEYIGTGPFQFVEWKQDQHVHLTKFNDYEPLDEPASGLAGKKEALVDDLRFIFTPDSSTQVAGIQSGEYDIAHEVHRDSLEQLENDPNIVNHTYPDAFLLVHFNKKEGLFTDVKARQAVGAALNMEDIMKAAFTDEKYYTLSHNMMMPHQEEQWYSDIGKEEYMQNDPETAKRLLEEAGYNGEEITILTDREYEEHYNASVVVQAQLEAIGMNVNLEAYDWPTASDRREDETAYDIFIMGNVPVPEPTSNVYLMKDYAGWTDSPELDEIIREFRSQPSLDDAKEVYEDLQEWFYEYRPVIKVGDYNAVVSLRDTVKNFQEQTQDNRLILWNVSNDK